MEERLIITSADGISVVIFLARDVLEGEGV